MQKRIAFFAIVLALLCTASAGNANEVITYTYDALGRLVAVTHSGTVNNNLQTVYTHDPASNRHSVQTSGAAH